MRTFTIESPDQWNILGSKLKSRGYKPWQYQYMVNMPEGFHAYFWKDGKEQIEIVTHCKEVKESIFSFK